mmetsp:Transcript_20278/g.47076  ORF Transcript_20278/g.47076 Transcript_20278/m.47076 type:complete len:496 (-) Transcript_20278:78-1565(-)
MAGFYRGQKDTGRLLMLPPKVTVSVHRLSSFPETLGGAAPSNSSIDRGTLEGPLPRSSSKSRWAMGGLSPPGALEGQVLGGQRQWASPMGGLSPPGAAGSRSFPGAVARRPSSLNPESTTTLAGRPPSSTGRSSGPPARSLTSNDLMVTRSNVDGQTLMVKRLDAPHARGSLEHSPTLVAPPGRLSKERPKTGSMGTTRWGMGGLSPPGAVGSRSAPDAAHSRGTLEHSQTFKTVTTAARRPSSTRAQAGSFMSLVAFPASPKTKPAGTRRQSQLYQPIGRSRRGTICSRVTSTSEQPGGEDWEDSCPKYVGMSPKDIADTVEQILHPETGARYSSLEKAISEEEEEEEEHEQEELEILTRSDSGEDSVGRHGRAARHGRAEEGGFPLLEEGGFPLFPTEEEGEFPAAGGVNFAASATYALGYPPYQELLPPLGSFNTCLSRRTLSDLPPIRPESPAQSRNSPPAHTKWCVGMVAGMAPGMVAESFPEWHAGGEP